MKRRTKVYVYIAFMPKAEQQEFRKNNGSVGRWLVSHIVSKKFNIPLEHLEIEEHQSGKPFFVSCPEIPFNLSDSGDLIICAFAKQDGISIGVDLEMHKKVNLNIIHRFFHPNEIAYVESATAGKEQMLRMLEIWTLKEAYVKCLGTGLNLQIKEFDMTNENFNIRKQTKRDDEIGYTLSTIADTNYKVIYNTAVKSLWDLSSH